MRDNRFIATHRGGLMTIDNHRGLMRWARECSEHILSLSKPPIDERLLYALEVAREWEEGKARVGKAMKASLGAHAVARELTNPVEIAIARSIGQGVATAHMADHSLGAALYGLKAVQLVGNSVSEEWAWQRKRLLALPADIVELVESTIITKGAGFGLNFSI